MTYTIEMTREEIESLLWALETSALEPSVEHRLRALLGKEVKP